MKKAILRTILLLALFTALLAGGSLVVLQLKTGMVRDTGSQVSQGQTQATTGQAENGTQAQITTEQTGTEPQAQTTVEQAGTEPQAQSATEQERTEPQSQTATEQAGTEPQSQTTAEQTGTKPQSQTATEQAGTEPQAQSAMGQTDNAGTDASGSSEDSNGSGGSAEKSTGESENAPRELTLMMVGDNLMHMGIVRTGFQSDGSTDYSFLFAPIADFLEAADVKIINQETILGGNDLGFSGFPYFNSPTEVGDAIAAAGFNVVLHASNHAADQKLSGLQSCAAYWTTHPEILMTGIHGEKITEPSIPLLTVDGVTIAILNYTYSSNTEILPKELWGHLDMLCDWNEKTGRMDFTKINPQVLADIQAADELADIVVVCPHWGTEYTTKPSTYQRQWAEAMTEAGANLILGTHPHVVQPVEWVESENKNRSLCFYSLGNYVSTQKQAISMLEAMAWVTFREQDGGFCIDPDQSGAIPLVCQYRSGPLRLEGIYPLETYTEEQAASHGILGHGGSRLRKSDLDQWAEEILGESILPLSQLHFERQ